ncbi:MAG: glycosyltransferase family 2 protein [candidate division KSB1 bacterium]|nr:glycosyltransferase family 2 protein [candidate division KSB1 bacterium]
MAAREKQHAPTAQSGRAPTISVIIPAYKAGRWLGRAVASCQAQTLPATEIIIVDDGSRDDTLAVAEKLAAQHHNLRVLQQPHNQGPAAARNRGVAESRGEFLAFLDADDTWAPDKLEKQMAIVQARPETALVFTALQERDVHGRKLREVWHRVPHERRRRVIASFLFRLNMLTPTLLLPRRIFERAGGFDERLRMGEDHLLFMKIAAVHEVVYLPELLVDRWVVPASSSKSGAPAALQAAFQQFMEVAVQHFPYLREHLPALTAKMHFQVGRRFQKQGDRRSARRHFLASLRTRPGLKAGVAWLTALLPAAWQALFHETPRRRRLFVTAR